MIACLFDRQFSDKELELLQEACSHNNYHQFSCPWECDGYFTRDQFLERVLGDSDAEQCEYIAHIAIF